MTGVPGYHRGSNSADSGDELLSLKASLAETQEALAMWSITVADFDKILVPYWDEKNYLFDCLVNTHGEIMAPNGIAWLVYDPAKKDRRAPLFAAMDALALEYGPTLKERRAAALEAKLLTKEVDHIKKRIDQLTKRQEKKRDKKATTN
jgi:hypothetical protein